MSNGSTTALSRTGLWRDISTLIGQLWAAHPLAFLSTVVLLVAGNVRTGLYVAAIGGVVGALVDGQSGGHSTLFWLGVYIAANALEELHYPG